MLPFNFLTEMILHVRLNIRKAFPFITQTLSFQESSVTFYQMSKSWSSPKLKAFVDNNFIMAQMVQFLSDGVENIVRKGENASYQHFLLFPQFLFEPTHGERDRIVRTSLQSVSSDLSGPQLTSISKKVGTIVLALSQTSPGFYMSAVQVF